MKNLAGKISVVTDAVRGIGKGIALGLATQIFSMTAGLEMVLREVGNVPDFLVIRICLTTNIGGLKHLFVF